MAMTPIEQLTAPRETIVVLLCGLPGVGKSSLSRSLSCITRWKTVQSQQLPGSGEYDGQGEDATIDWHVIEYDQLERQCLQGILLSQQSAPSDEITRQVWKEARTCAMATLTQVLRQDISKVESIRRDWIIMDDNFHLSSMRKQVLHAVQSFLQESTMIDTTTSAITASATADDDNDTAATITNSRAKATTTATVTATATATKCKRSIYMSLVWLEVPEELARDRNASRTEGRVSTVTMDKLRATQEVSPSEPWEHRVAHCKWVLTESDAGCDKDSATRRDTWTCSVCSCGYACHLPQECAGSPYTDLTNSVMNFLSHVSSHHQPISLSDLGDDVQQQIDRQDTQKSHKHQIDQVLRQCVGIIGKAAPVMASQANKVRQSMLKSIDLSPFTTLHAKGHTSDYCLQGSSIDKQKLVDEFVKQIRPEFVAHDRTEIWMQIERDMFMLR
jgi:AAA domain